MSMLLKEIMTTQLMDYWSDEAKKGFNFLPAESTENDIEQIITYNEAVIETAFACHKISLEQWLTANESIGKIKEVLKGKTTALRLKQIVVKSSPEETLQSLLTFSDESVNALLRFTNNETTNFSEPIIVNQDPNTLYFLYRQQSSEAICYDRYIQRDMPVNGGTEFCCYDNYLPVYKQIEKYFPQTKTCLINDKKQAKGKYIYMLTFNFFPDYYLQHSHNLLSLIPSDVLEDCRAGKAILIYNDLDGATAFRPIIKQVQQQLQSAGIIHSFYLLSGDWGNQALMVSTTTSNTSLCKKILRFFPAPSTPVKVFISNYFEEAMAFSQQLYNSGYTYDTKFNAIKNQPTSLKHFICLNRIVKDYRVYLSYFFYQNDLLDKVHISQSAYKEFSDFQYGYNKITALWKGLDESKFEKFKQLLPWAIDTGDVKSLSWDTVPLSALNSSFCWVVTETSFADTLPTQSFRLTEKTYKPIAYFMPFIMVGNPFVLENLKKNGYRTFSNWWDESYDSIVEPIERMKKITEVILKISKLSKPELIKIYEEMRPVLMHNYEVLMKSDSSKTAMQAILNQYFKN